MTSIFSDTTWSITTQLTWEVFRVLNNNYYKWVTNISFETFSIPTYDSKYVVNELWSIVQANEYCITEWYDESYFYVVNTYSYATGVETTYFDPISSGWVTTGGGYWFDLISCMVTPTYTDNELIINHLHTQTALMIIGLVLFIWYIVYQLFLDISFKWVWSKIKILDDKN